MNVHVHAVNRHDPKQYALKAQCTFRDRTVLQLSCLVLSSIHVCCHRLQKTCTLISNACMYSLNNHLLIIQSENILVHNMKYVPTFTFNKLFLVQKRTDLHIHEQTIFYPNIDRHCRAINLERKPVNCWEPWLIRDQTTIQIRVFETDHIFYNIPRALFPSAPGKYATIVSATCHQQCKKYDPILVNVSEPCLIWDLTVCVKTAHNIHVLSFIVVVVVFPIFTSFLRCEYRYVVNVNIYQYFNTPYG